jgi:hypothetical protein
VTERPGPSSWAAARPGRRAQAPGEGFKLETYYSTQSPIFGQVPDAFESSTATRPPAAAGPGLLVTGSQSLSQSDSGRIRVMITAGHGAWP